MSSKRTLATMFGIGLIPRAPGTAGSLVAALLAYPILLAPYGWALLMAGTALVTFLGTQSAARYMEAHTTAHDPGEIVVDELAGQWLTYSIWHGWLIAMAGRLDVAAPLLADVAATPLFLVAGFVLFRLFDIAKPWPIRWADRKLKGGFGVMADDLLAGVAAGTLLYVLYLFSPFLLGHVESTV